MSITLTAIDPAGADQDALIGFFSTQTFPFHVFSAPWSDSTVMDRIASGYFLDADNSAFWLDHDELGRIGYVRVEDLHDDTPMFDLRLCDRYRGRGLGVDALNAITDYVFSRTQALRFEGQTCEDNHAMRSVFEHAGWTKEAQYRDAWPCAGGMRMASVAYAILRTEWDTGTTVGVHWHDRSYFRPREGSGIAYSSNVLPPFDELLNLYNSVGWSAYTEDSARLHRSLIGSDHVVCARADEALVGLARVVSDFGTLVYLQDVLVDPRMHRRGIGAELVRAVLEPFTDIRQTVLLTDDEPTLAGFYTALGFTEASAAAGSTLRAFVRV